MKNTNPESFIPKAFLRRPNFSTFTPNERRFMSLLRRNGATSRVELARLSELSVQSAIRIVDALLAREMVVTGGKIVSGPGQPSVPISLAKNAAFTFGVSLRQDGMTLVLIDIEGSVRGSVRIADKMSDRLKVIDVLKTNIDKLLTVAQVPSERLFGVGVAMSGYFVENGRKLNTPIAMGDWALRDIAHEMSIALDLPVWIENDGNAAAVGENLYGAGQTIKNFAYLYIDMGLGGALVSDGRLDRGRHGNAGEFTGLLAPELRPDRPTLTNLRETLADHGTLFSSLEELIENVVSTTPGVTEWLDRIHRPLTQIFSAIAAICDSEAIVIGGRLPTVLSELISQRGTYFQVPIRDLERPFPNIIPAQLTEDPAALGAAAIPLATYFFESDTGQ